MKWVQASEGNFPKIGQNYFLRHPYEDGRWYGWWSYVNNIDRDYWIKMGIEWLDETPSKEAEKVSDEWISVEDGSPDDGQRCIVVQNPKTTATRHSLYGVYDADKKKFKNVGYTHDGVHLGVAYWADIILWRPLPQPPKE